MASLRPVFDLRFVAMSVGIAYIGSYVTICLCEQFRLCTSAITKPKLLDRKLLLMLMSCSMGGVGIWTMHFIGMSSLILYDPDGNEVPIKFNLFRTIMSLVVVLLLSCVGLYIASFDKVFTKTKQEVIEMFVTEAKQMSMAEIMRIKNTRFLMLITSQSIGYLLFGGFWAGSGVCVMHYMGFWAMEFKGRIVWNQGIVAASLFIALIAETLAFWILFRLLSLYPHLEVLRFGSACAMALAVCGMHYTGMAAAKFEFQHETSPYARYGFLDGSMNGYDAFYGTLTVATVFVLTLLQLALADLRAWHYNVLKHLQRADDLILQLQRDNSSGPQQHNAAQLNNYLVNRQSDNNTMRSSRASLSTRQGAVLLKPSTPSFRRQQSGGIVPGGNDIGINTVTTTAGVDNSAYPADTPPSHARTVSSEVNSNPLDLESGIGFGRGGGGVHQSTNPAALSTHSAPGSGKSDEGSGGGDAMIIDEDPAAASRNRPTSAEYKFYHQLIQQQNQYQHQHQVASHHLPAKHIHYTPITRLFGAPLEGKDEDKSEVISENNPSVFHSR